jgi:hypothetical protein
MDASNNELRRRIFRQELYSLKENGYINDDVVEVVSKAHQQYHVDLLNEKKALEERQQIEKLKRDNDSNFNSTSNVSVAVSVKPKKTVEEIRERNITWLLNLGVIMLLIGGLFVATSNWETMNSLMKSSSIAAVSLVFYGFAYLSSYILKIEKTAFAFTVLGSLFLPIFVLSLGWFGLLGSYLSINGDGRYYLGVLGSFLPIIVYLNFAKRLHSRLFVWFSYISITIGIAFLLAALRLPLDYFYLGMVIYNILLVLCFYKLRNKVELALFTQEMLIFVQINLVLSTLTMLFLFDDHVNNGFNLILTAIIYLSMIFITGKKEYHFIFTSMLVYGAYQIIEHSFLETVGPILFAIIGIVLLFIPRWIKEMAYLERVFQLTSAVVSVLAFVYISLEGLLLRMGEASIILVIAYFIIGSHFLYMCTLVKSHLFRYLSPVFYAASILELISLLNQQVITIPFSFEFFLSGFLVLLLLGIGKPSQRLAAIRKSSLDIGLIIVTGALFLAIVEGDWQELGLMLITFSLISYLVIRYEDRKLYREVGYWTLPIAISLAFVAFGEEITLQNDLYARNAGWVGGYIAGSLILLLISVFLKKLKENVLEKNSIIVTGIGYSIGLIFSLLGEGDALWVRPFVLLGGVFIYLLLFIRTKHVAIPYVTATVMLLFYFSVMYSIDLQMGIPHSLEVYVPTGGGILLLLVALLLIKRNKMLFQGFTWVGQLFYSFSLLLSYFIFDNVTICFMAAIVIYCYSFYLSERKRLKYVFLYTIFTLIAGVTSEILHGNRLDIHDEHWTFILTSGLMILIWLFIKSDYKMITLYYWIPFSIVGVLSCVDSNSYTASLFIITIGYLITILLFSWIAKWTLVPIIPSFLLWVATIRFIEVSKWSIQLDFALTAAMGLVLLWIGRKWYKSIYHIESKKILLDVYSPIAILFFIYLYFMDIDIIWLHAAPGLLIVFALFMQRTRVPKVWGRIISTFAGIYLLEPYYSIMLKVELPNLLEREILLLPWLLLIIFIRKYWKGYYPSQTSLIHWMGLIVVALLLIEDGLSSSTVNDAIILGTLSLISLLVGAFLRVKSYFLVGAGVLLLNVFLQTKPYWGNMPWWAYLLVAGSILIFVASYNEWHKQKIAKGETTFFTKVKSQFLRKWKEWK